MDVLSQKNGHVIKSRNLVCYGSEAVRFRINFQIKFKIEFYYLKGGSRPKADIHVLLTFLWYNEHEDNHVVDLVMSKGEEMSEEYDKKHSYLNDEGEFHSMNDLWSSVEGLIPFALEEWQGKEIKNFVHWLTEAVQSRRISPNDFVKAVGPSFKEDDFWNLLQKKSTYVPDVNLQKRIAFVLGIDGKKELKQLGKFADSARKWTQDARILSFPETEIYSPTEGIIKKKDDAITLEENSAYYKNLVAAREVFYQFLNDATNGEVTSAEDLANVTGADIAFLQGLRLQRKNELQKNSWTNLNLDSEYAKDTLEELRNFFGMVRTSPPSKETETSASEYHKDHGGGADGIRSQWLQLRDEEIEKEIIGGIKPYKAEQEVDEKLFGMREALNGRAALHATEEGIELYLERFPQLPKIQEGEISARQLAKTHYGSRVNIDNQWRLIRKDEIKDRIDNGMKPFEAEQEVDETLFGMRRLGTESAICATQEGIKLWKARYEAKDEELSVIDLSQREGRSKRASSDSLHIFYKELIEDRIAKGMEPLKAEQEVERNLAGKRYANSKGRKFVLHLLKDGVELYDKRFPYLKIDDNMIAAKQYAERFGGRGSRIRLKLKILREELINDRIDQGIKPLEAEQEVDTKFIGMRIDKTGDITPHMTEEGIELYQIRFPKRNPVGKVEGAQDRHGPSKER